MRLLGICLASFSSGSYLIYSYETRHADSEFRLGRNYFSSTFNNLFAFIYCWSQCWVMPSLSLMPIKLNTIEVIFPQVQVPQDLWEHSFGGRCVALEYAPGLAYRQYVPRHLLVIIYHSRVGQLIGSASRYPVNLLPPPSS